MDYGQYNTTSTSSLTAQYEIKREEQLEYIDCEKKYCSTPRDFPEHVQIARQKYHNSIGDIVCSLTSLNSFINKKISDYKQVTTGKAKQAVAADIATGVQTLYGTNYKDNKDAQLVEFYNNNKSAIDTILSAKGRGTLCHYNSATRDIHYTQAANNIIAQAKSIAKTAFEVQTTPSVSDAKNPPAFWQAQTPGNKFDLFAALDSEKGFVFGNEKTEAENFLDSFEFGQKPTEKPTPLMRPRSVLVPQKAKPLPNGRKLLKVSDNETLGLPQQPKSIVEATTPEKRGRTPTTTPMPNTIQTIIADGPQETQAKKGTTTKDPFSYFK